MDWNRIEGNWKEFRGQVKEKWGKITDDDLTAIDGKRDQLEGRLQHRYGLAKDQARGDVSLEEDALNRPLLRRLGVLESLGKRVDENDPRDAFWMGDRVAPHDHAACGMAYHDERASLSSRLEQRLQLRLSHFPRISSSSINSVSSIYGFSYFISSIPAAASLAIYAYFIILD